MSSLEYTDLFLKAQNNSTSPYHIFTFDIVNSKGLDREDYLLIRNTLFKIINDLLELLKKIELDQNKTILINKEFDDHSSGFGLKTEPFILGDMIGFTIYRGSLSFDEIMDIFDKIKKHYHFDYPLHIANGYYETNNYEEGNKKLFRGYCIDILSNMHKTENKPKNYPKWERK